MWGAERTFAINMMDIVTVYLQHFGEKNVRIHAAGVVLLYLAQRILANAETDAESVLPVIDVTHVLMDFILSTPHVLNVFKIVVHAYPIRCAMNVLMACLVKLVKTHALTTV